VSRRDEILTVAGELFFERGFHGVGVDEIGARAGITGPGLYRHFQGKDELLGTLFNRAMDLVTVRDVPDESPQEALDRLIIHHSRFAVEHRHLLSVYAHEHRSLVEPWRRRFLRRVREHARRWERAIAACYPDADSADVAIATQGAIGLIHSVIDWPPALLAREDIVTRLRDMICSGLESLAPVPAE
jgi:AcrR family transcriptional regulator